MSEILETRISTGYFNREGLRTLTGLSESLWDFAIFKELLDNSLDALNKKTDKRIDIEYTDSFFAIYDSGDGITPEILSRIYDFDVYVSSNRDFRRPTRGAQGNALKTIIGICELNDYTLSFITLGKKFTYNLNRIKRQAGIIQFNVKEENTEEKRSGVIIDGCMDIDRLQSTLWTYYLCNPDVTFTLNGSQAIYPAVTDPVNRIDKTFIHYYDFVAFNELLQLIHIKDPDRTVKAFCGDIFSGTQRILSQIVFPHKKLSDFDSSPSDIKALYKELKEKTKSPSPDILKKYITGKENLIKIYGDKGEYKYKIVTGEYKKNEAVIPYVIEGFLLQQDTDSPVKILTSINNSVPYTELPFEFERNCYVEFCKERMNVFSVNGLLSGSGFKKAIGITLYINFICPVIPFTSKSKTGIITDLFKNDLIDILEYLCKDAIKEVKKAERARRKFDRQAAIKPMKETSNKDLMKEYFVKALSIAKGKFPVVTARQIFYKMRELINLQLGIELTSDKHYDTFTQKIVTYFMDLYPELEECILFERRGFFNNPFLNQDLPIGTYDVMNYIDRSYSEKIYDKIETCYDIPPELQFNKVLFIEKAGYDTLFKRTGFTKKLHMGVISTSGFSNRASKKLMEYFIDRDIKVYVLHDCDIAGYLIGDKISKGSDTFKRGLNVTHIGLKVEDVFDLQKEHTAETVTYQRDYTDSLKILTEDELNFFKPCSYGKEFRRVELNNLTNDELMDFIKSKVSDDPIVPDKETLQKYVNIDWMNIYRESLINAFGEFIDNATKRLDLALAIDDEEQFKLPDIILNNISESEDHWTQVLIDTTKEFNQRKIKELSQQMKEYFLAWNKKRAA